MDRTRLLVVAVIALALASCTAPGVVTPTTTPTATPLTTAPLAPAANGAPPFAQPTPTSAIARLYSCTMGGGGFTCTLANTPTPTFFPTRTPTPSATTTPLTTVAPLTATATITNTATITATVALTTTTSTSTPILTPTVPVTPTLAASPTPSANAVVPGALNLSATFNSIAIELVDTGDLNHNATATLQFRRSADPTWRDGLPLWPVSAPADGGPTAFYGSALLLDPATNYDVQVTLGDPDGVTGPTVLTASVTTWTPAPQASALTPSYFVDPTGADTNAGTLAAPWRSLTKALTSAPSGAIVQFAPGEYPATRVIRALPITLVAQLPATDDNGNLANAGQHSIIEWPDGTLPNSGSWVQVAPDPSQPLNVVWQFTASSTQYGADQMGWLDANGIVQKVAYWKADPLNWPTAAAWADVLYSNLTYRYGFWRDPTNPSHVDARLPNDVDPNTVRVLLGAFDGLELFGPQMRVSGFEFRALDNAIVLTKDSVGIQIDHNWCQAVTACVRLAASPPSGYPRGVVFASNRFSDTNLWDADHGDFTALPWDFIKSCVKMPSGACLGYKPGDSAENAAVTGRAARDLVIQGNVCTGTHDCFADYIDSQGSGGYDRYANYNSDITGNRAIQLQDDVVEGDGPAINWRIWGNTWSQTGTCFSTSLTYGPVYYFRNVCDRVGTEGLQPDQTGYTQPGGIGVKYGTDGTLLGPPARLYLVNNTFWTDWVPSSGIGVSGGGWYFGGGSSQLFYLRNNIFSTSYYPFAYPSPNAVPGGWDEDYDYFATTATVGLEAWGNANGDPTVALYRAHSGQGAHSQAGDASGAFHTAPGFTDPVHGDFSLGAGAAQRGAGMVVPNIDDGVNGTALDLGAR